MRRLGLLVALAACGTSSAAPSTVKVLAEVPAWDTAAVANRIVVIDDGFKSVTAFDAATGKRAWRHVLEKEARGRHMLLLDGGAVIAWFGEKAHVLDGATGKRGASWTAPMNGIDFREGGCWIDVAEGVCALRCQCSFQVVDCATGAKRGRSYLGRYMEEIDPDGGRSAGCRGFGGSLFGRAGKQALIGTEDYRRGTGKQLGQQIVAGIDLGTGREAWRTALSPIADDAFSGHTPDGKTCWFSTNVDGLSVLDCATGKQLWKTGTPPRDGAHVTEHVPGRGLFELSGRRAALLEERGGGLVWATMLPAGTTAVLEGSTQPIDLQHSNASQVAILDPASGNMRATIPIPKGATLVRDRAGGFLVSTSTELVAYAAAGTVTGRAPLASPGIVVGDTLIVATLPSSLVVLARGDLRELARIPRTAATVHVEGPLGANRIAAFRYDAKSVGTLSLYAITP